MIFRKKPLHLRDLACSAEELMQLQSLTKEQRAAIYNECTRIYWTSYDLNKRKAAFELREHFRKVSINEVGTNKCEFDKTEMEKKKDHMKNVAKKNPLAQKFQ